MIQRFGDVAIDPERVIAVSRKPNDNEPLASQVSDQSVMVMRGIDADICVIPISEAGATALLEHFGKKPEVGNAIQVLAKCSCCGCVPHFYQKYVTAGHGDTPVEWHVCCGCGMQTRGFQVGYGGTEQQCKDKAAAVWNRRD